MKSLERTHLVDSQRWLALEVIVDSLNANLWVGFVCPWFFKFKNSKISSKNKLLQWKFLKKLNISREDVTGDGNRFKTNRGVEVLPFHDPGFPFLVYGPVLITRYTSWHSFSLYSVMMRPVRASPPGFCQCIKAPKTSRFFIRRATFMA